MDIHTHILPGVDDGAKTKEEALEMLKLQIKSGITKVVLTPHVNNNVQKVSSKRYEDLFNEFSKYVYDNLEGIKLYLGYEVKYNPMRHTNYEEYIFKGFKHKYILIEFSTNHEEPITEVVYNLLRKGFIPIVAHAERYLYLKFDDVKQLKEDGALIQINSGALLGNDGRVYKKQAYKFLKHQFIDFIASDTHNMHDRKPNLALALKKFAKNFQMKTLEE